MHSWLVRQGTWTRSSAGASTARVGIKGWESMRGVSAVRPAVPQDRIEWVLYEGLAMFFIEECTRQKAVRHLCGNSGFGMSADAHHLTMPLVAGLEAIERSDRDAVIAAVTVGYINTHGTATQVNTFWNRPPPDGFGEPTDIYLSVPQNRSRPPPVRRRSKAAATILGCTRSSSAQHYFNEDIRSGLNIIRTTRYRQA